MIHVVVKLYIITFKGLIEEWFMLLLLYCLSLLFKVWERSGSYCCFIVYHSCFMFDRGVVHVVVVGYMVYHYSFRFDRGVGDVDVVILSTITIYSLIEERFKLLLLFCLSLLFKV
jgi:hypothetical protein